MDSTVCIVYLMLSSWLRLRNICLCNHTRPNTSRYPSKQVVTYILCNYSYSFLINVILKIIISSRNSLLT